MYRGLKLHLTKTQTGSTKKKMRRADLVVLNYGLHDQENGVSPAKVVRNITRTIAFLRKHFTAKEGSAPLIAVATLIPAKSTEAAQYLKKLNRLLLKKSSDELPIYVRFDKISRKLLGMEGIYPKPKGYDALAAIAEEYIVGEAQVESLALRPDTDGDGIYDLFETIKFNTDPVLEDSDGDGYSDGEEVFTLKSDPLDAHSPNS